MNKNELDKKACNRAFDDIASALADLYDSHRSRQKPYADIVASAESAIRQLREIYAECGRADRETSLDDLESEP